MCSSLRDQDLAQEVGGIQDCGANLSPLSPWELETWGEKGNPKGL